MVSFPTILADLECPNHLPNLYQSMKDLKKTTLSLQNRFRSIKQDAEFVIDAQEAFTPNGKKLPIIANERCGSWYVPPSRKHGSAYFKSTDGHYGQWGFSLRRLNLQLLSVVGEHEGAIIIDTTRRGKTMPDALTKTIPIWATVINRALFPELPKPGHLLQRAPPVHSYGEAEASRIEAKLDAFTTSFLGLGLDVKKLRKELRKPIKLFWIYEHFLDGLLDTDWESYRTTHKNFHLVMLCSASRRVYGAEMSQDGYIQGAGDDSENWSMGLTPEIFWQYETILMTKSDSELEDLIPELVREAARLTRPGQPIRITPTSNLYIAQSSEKEDENLVALQHFDLTINCGKSAPSVPRAVTFELGCRQGKLGSRDLRATLEPVEHFVSLRLKRDLEQSILVTCGTGKDLSVGVALMLLCRLYDEAGKVILDARPAHNGQVDKTFVRQRLAWITSSMPEAGPSRSTLQSVNAYLMQENSGKVGFSS